MPKSDRRFVHHVGGGMSRRRPLQRRDAGRFAYLSCALAFPTWTLSRPTLWPGSEGEAAGHRPILRATEGNWLILLGICGVCPR